MLVGAVLLACPLVVATQLRPEIAGLGTHQQLGLPPCTVRILWGIRCPACGMTTSWAHLVRGRWLESLQANAGGFALGLVDVALSIGLAGHAAAARLPSRQWAIVLAWALSASLALSLVDWGWRLANGG